MFGLSWLTDKLAAGIAGFLLVSTIALGIGLVATRTTLHSRTLELAAEKSGHDADRKAWAAATATAQLQDQQHADTVKTAQDKITTEKADDLSKQLADARAIAARYVASHRVQPSAAADNHGTGRTSDLPPVADTSVSTDGAPTQAVISANDVDACTQAYVTAQGWQDWWIKEASVDRGSGSGDLATSDPGDTSLPTAPQK